MKVIISTTNLDDIELNKQYRINNKEFWETEGDDLEISDGYHTFTELYNHRHALFCALTKIYDNYITPLQTRVKCWKSRFHSDGSSLEGWFIVGMTITEFDGPKSQITYHLPNEWWDKFKLLELSHAPTYDGHTPNDVIERLMKL